MTPKELYGKYMLVSLGEEVLPLVFGHGSNKYILVFHNDSDPLWFVTKAKRMEMGIGLRPLIPLKINAYNICFLEDALKFERAELRMVVGPKTSLKEKGVLYDIDS